MNLNHESQLIQNILSQHSLFSQCASEHLDQLMEGCTLRTYRPGEEMKSYDENPFLCVIQKGSALVYSKDGGSDLLLRILKAGDTFGVATLFGKNGETAVTKIIAEDPTEALCIREEAVRALIMADGEFAMRYIDFLADRIRFLNQRISCIGAGSAEDKLCAWLAHRIPSECSDYVLTVPMSYSQLADSLGLGRASLYRALDELETRGIIRREGKQIYMLAPSALRSL